MKIKTIKVQLNMGGSIEVKPWNKTKKLSFLMSTAKKIKSLSGYEDYSFSRVFICHEFADAIHSECPYETCKLAPIIKFVFPELKRPKNKDKGSIVWFVSDYERLRYINKLIKQLKAK